MNITINPLGKKELKQYLMIKNLIKSKEDNALKLIYLEIKRYIHKTHPNSKVLVYHLNPIVKIKDNFDELLIPNDNVSRSSRYSHYVDKKRMLRTHTSARMTSLINKLARKNKCKDMIIMLPGLVYRRDVTDKLHLGVCHQLDIWRVIKGISKSVDKNDLLKVIHGIIKLEAPGWKERIVNMPHPYTKEGVEVNVDKKGREIEILEAGLINDQILYNAQLDPDKHSGWAMGMGLDRLVMTRKDIPDIRYIRSENPEIAEQMKDLELYKEVSNQPSIKRDMSYCVPGDYVEEDIHEDIRNALDEGTDIIESIEVLNEVDYGKLPKIARVRLGCSRNQKNVLVRVTLRHLSRTLTKTEANKLYDLIYRRVNYGRRGYNKGKY